LHTTKKLAGDRPSFTIVKSEGNGGLYHPDEPRMLSQSEFTRIASFPDAFRWAGSRKDWQERIGNSVPPLFMRAIAGHVRSLLESAAARPNASDSPASFAGALEAAGG
jgi:DNA (cytosine-5)-methyltransferase 1